MTRSDSQPLPIKPARWFCRIDGAEVGPITDKALRQMAQSGRLTQAVHVRLGLTGKWVRAVQVKGLFSTSEAGDDPAPNAVTPSSPSSLPGLTNDWEPATDNSDPLSSGVPVLAFANPDALVTEPQDEALAVPGIAQSPQMPPLGSVYLQRTPTASDECDVSSPAIADGQTKNTTLLWIAAGSGGLVLLTLIGVGSAWLLRTDTRAVASNESPTVSPRQSHATLDTTEQFNDEGTTGDLVLEPFSDDPVQSVPTVSESGVEIDAALVPSADSLLKPVAEVQGPKPAVATTTDSPTSADLGEVAASSTKTTREPVVNTPLPVAEANLAEPKSATVAATVASEPGAGDERVERERMEASEAAKLVLEINANVQRRLQQIAERIALGKQMEASRAEYQQVVTAIGIATSDLPRMERQYAALQERRREAIARMSTERAFIQVEANLAREMAVLAQQITQVTTVGNAALRAKPGLEQQGGEQNKQLADLQQREGTLHEELMAVLDPYGHQSRQYREQLLSKGSQWDASCVEAALIRGLAHYHDGRHERAVEDFSRVLTTLGGVLKQRRIAKDSPELKVVQTALAARGLTLFKLGKEPEGFADLGKAVGANPLYALPVMFRGLAEAQRGRHEAALQDFEAARRLNDPHANRETARLLVTSPSLNNPIRALTLAKEGCSLATSWSNQEVLAAALFANSQFPLAREAYREARNRAPVDQWDRLNGLTASLPE